MAWMADKMKIKNESKSLFFFYQNTDYNEQKKIYSWKNNQKIWLKCHKTKNITLQSKKIVRIKQKTRSKKCIMTNIMTNMIYIVIKMNLTRVLTNVKSND